MLSKQEVRHIAKLARLSLTEKEIEKYQKDLSAILDYIEKLKEVDVENVKPTSHSIEMENITRKDEAELSNPATRQKMTDQMPDKEGDYLKVKSIL